MAKNCVETEFYVCPQCGEFHNDKDGAKDCCDLDTETRYVCEKCGTRHYDKADALICCWQNYHQEKAVPGLPMIPQAFALSFNAFRATKEYRDIFQKGHDEGARGLPLSAAHYEIPAYSAAHTDGWRCGFAFYTGRKEAQHGLAFMPKRFEDPLVQNSYRDGYVMGETQAEMTELWGGV